MQINPDYTDCKSKTCPPEGRYKARVVACEKADKLDNDGFPQIQWVLRIIHDEPSFSGFEFKHSTSVGGKWAWTTRQLYQAIEPTYASGPFDTKDCVGKDVEVTIVRPVDPKTGQISRWPRARDIGPVIVQGSVSSEGLHQNVASESVLPESMPPF